MSIPQSDKWVIPRWRLLNCLMAAVIFDPLGFCEKIIEWILRLFYYRDLPASAIPNNLKVFSKTPVCSDRFFDLLVSSHVQKTMSIQPSSDESKAFRHSPMAESRLPPPRRIRPRDHTPRPTIIQNITPTPFRKVPSPSNHPRTLPNPHLRNRLHPPLPPDPHLPPRQIPNKPRTSILVPPSLPPFSSHHLRPQQHLARRNRQRRLPFDRLLQSLAVHLRSAQGFPAFDDKDGELGLGC